MPKCINLSYLIFQDSSQLQKIKLVWIRPCGSPDRQQRVSRYELKPLFICER